MRVTSFKDYIESPYGFYLKHIARLEEVDDKAVEMDPLRFGNLIHDCLKMLKDSDQARSDNPDRIAAFLCANLDALSAQWFGDTTLPTVRLQLAHAKLRLREFARWQAENARLGWKILHTEWNPDPGAAFIDVDGVPMGLRGRIDRIDIDEAEGILRVLDYKTGESAADPKSTRSRDGRWKDLQLPLYRHLVKPLGAVDRIQLGFFALPKSIAHTAFNEAEWDETDLAAADDAAREVIRAVRAGRFDDIGTSPPSEGILSAICGQGMSLEDEEDDTEDPA
jgi:ATP-dependent helicase/DNAse subunit B